MDKTDFITRFGGIFEHSPFIAERAIAAEPDLAPTAAAVHAAMVAVFRAASREEQLGVLRAHPDLAGRLAIAGALTEDSKAEQASAGLDRLTEEEHARFPFIIAVKGLRKDDILAAFEARIGNDAETEFQTALAQVEKIAGLRLTALLP